MTLIGDFHARCGSAIDMLVFWGQSEVIVVGYGEN